MTFLTDIGAEVGKVATSFFANQPENVGKQSDMPDIRFSVVTGWSQLEEGSPSPPAQPGVLLVEARTCNDNGKRMTGSGLVHDMRQLTGARPTIIQINKDFRRCGTYIKAPEHKLVSELVRKRETKWDYTFVAPIPEDAPTNSYGNSRGLRAVCNMPSSFVCKNHSVSHGISLTIIFRKSSTRLGFVP